MADSRFFSVPSAKSLAQIASRIGAVVYNPADADYVVEDVASLDHADERQLSFLDNRKFRDQFHVSKAGACIVHPDMIPYAPAHMKLLVAEAPYKAYALAAQMFYPESRPEVGVSPFARIHPTAKIGANCVVEDFVVVGAGAEIGANVWLESHAVIGAGVVLGENCRIGLQATVTHAVFGKNVRLYPGVRVGQDGFGFAIDPAGFVKVPQLGRVIIHDNVEIGANTTIDRGAMGDTVIGAGTWIDNLVQIAHNVKIGRGCVLVSQVGVAGSTELGDFVILAGQVGVAGHLKIGSLSKVAAQSGVTRDIPPKSEWMGYPAMPMKQYLRQTAVLNRLVAEKSHITKK